MITQEDIDNCEKEVRENMMIKSMDFARVVSDKKLKGSGLVRGDMVMVVGTKQVPAKRSDPYLMRTVMFVAKMENDLPLVSAEDTKFLVDPRSLEKVSDEEASRLNTILEDKYQG